MNTRTKHNGSPPVVEGRNDRIRVVCASDLGFLFLSACVHVKKVQASLRLLE